MELFVYVRMGGKRERLVSRLLDDSTDLATRLAKFDAEDARCYLDNDRQKLLAVIEAAFGTFTPFNTIVRRIGDKALHLGKSGAAMEYGERPPLEEVRGETPAQSEVGMTMEVI